MRYFDINSKYHLHDKHKLKDVILKHTTLTCNICHHDDNRKNPFNCMKN